MEKDALDTLIALAATQALKFDQLQHPLAALPNDCNIHNLERYLPQPLRRRATFSATLISAFLDYCEREITHGSAIFIDAEHMSARAIIDHESDTGSPEWGTHQARLDLSRTPAYQALLHNANAGKAQLDLIDWIEDWQVHMRFFADNGNEIPLAQAIAAIRRLEKKSARNLTQEQDDFRAEKSTLEQVQIQAEAGMPARLAFTCSPYLGFQSRTFDCRLRASTQGDTILLHYRIQGLDATKEAIAREFQDILSGAAATGDAAVFIGTYAAAFVALPRQDST